MSLDSNCGGFVVSFRILLRVRCGNLRGVGPGRARAGAAGCTLERTSHVVTAPSVRKVAPPICSGCPRYISPRPIRISLESVIQHPVIYHLGVIPYRRCYHNAWCGYISVSATHGFVCFLSLPALFSSPWQPRCSSLTALKIHRSGAHRFQHRPPATPPPSDVRLLPQCVGSGAKKRRPRSHRCMGEMGRE